MEYEKGTPWGAFFGLQKRPVSAKQQRPGIFIISTQKRHR